MSSKVHIYQSSSQFDNNSISISRPVVIQGGTYFTKIRSINNTPYYVQFDSCKTKQGVVFTNKRSYVDLLYNNDDVDIIEWFENMQENVITKIYEQRHEWFQSEMERTDIENNFVNISKSYKGGKYHLIRVGMNTPGDSRNKGKSCVVFDEYENVISAEDIQVSESIEGILEVQGVRFTSKSFQIDMMCKQVKICQQESTFDKCMIKHSEVSPPEEKRVDTEYKKGTTETNTQYDIVAKKEQDEPANNIDILTEGNFRESQEVTAENKEATYAEEFSENSYSSKVEMEDKEKVVQVEVDLESENMEVEVTSVHEKREHVGMEVSRNPEDIPGGDRNMLEMEEMNTNTSASYLTSSSTKEERDNAYQEKAMVSRLEEEKEQEQQPEELALLDVSSSFEATISEGGETKSLKDPQDIYYEIYKIAKQKAREHKVKSITHYLEAKNIKNQYLLDDLEESDPEDDINDYYYDSDVTSQSTEYTEK